MGYQAARGLSKNRPTSETKRNEHQKYLLTIQTERFTLIWKFLSSA